jgi:hypothetical protein
MIGSSGMDEAAGLVLGNPGSATCWTPDASNPPDSNDNIYSNNLP